VVSTRATATPRPTPAGGRPGSVTTPRATGDTVKFRRVVWQRWAAWHLPLFVDVLGWDLKIHDDHTIEVFQRMLYEKDQSDLTWKRGIILFPFLAISMIRVERVDRRIIHLRGNPWPWHACYDAGPR
jgi:hypothetical protein